MLFCSANKILEKNKKQKTKQKMYRHRNRLPVTANFARFFPKFELKN